MPAIENAPGSSIAPEPLCWRVHLAARQPERAALVALVAIGAALLCFSLFGNWLFALLSLAALLTATGDFLWPMHFELDADGARLRQWHTRREIAWEEVRKAYVAHDGVKLSPLPTPSRLEAFRGVFLRFADNDDEVIAAVRRFRDRSRSDAD